MPVGAMLATLGAAASFGIASVLQHRGAASVATRERLDPFLLLRLARRLPFAMGLVLDGVGFALAAAALRELPLFVVQAGVAASLAVTAVLAARVLGDRLGTGDRVALVGVAVGLVLLASTGGDEAPVRLGAAAGVLAGGFPVLVVAAVVLHRRRPAWSGVGFGVLAGLAFGGFAVAGRVGSGASGAGLADPALWALVGYLLLGLFLYACSLQRGGVTQVTAAYVATEVLVPALVGVALLGDRPRPGAAALAVAGVAVTLAAVVVLARSGREDGRCVSAVAAG